MDLLEPFFSKLSQEFAKDFVFSTALEKALSDLPAGPLKVSTQKIYDWIAAHPGDMGIPAGTFAPVPASLALLMGQLTMAPEGPQKLFEATARYIKERRGDPRRAFIAGFAIMLSQGLALPEVLKTLAAEITDPKQKAILDQALPVFNAGETLAGAFAESGDAALIEAFEKGEEDGSLVDRLFALVP